MHILSLSRAVPQSPPPLYTLASVCSSRGMSKGHGHWRHGAEVWHLTPDNSKLSSHGPNSERTVLWEQSKLTLWIRQHVQPNYIM